MRGSTLRKIAPGRRLLSLWGRVALALSPAIILASPPHPSGRTSTPVILISIDTLRADHLSCYGYQKIRTPHFDALAEGGTLFRSIDCPAPMTLPSHTSLLTSTYPFAHGVEENGEQVRPGTVTLAAVLKAHGYRTAAFIGGYVLDARFGLNQGFDFYDSPFRIRPQPGEEPPDLKRSGEAVVRAAIQWLETHSDQPFLVFLHLYDLHQPYTLPATSGRYGYDTELSYVDEVLGRFWQFLAAKGLQQKTLIVLTSDHGESLGEHGESTHGYFVYQSTLWVPLLIHWPVGVGPYPARIDGPASLLDVAPAVLQSLGISAPPQFQGRSLLRFLDPNAAGAEEDVYSESLYARDHFGCSPLRSLRAGRYKYIQAPKPELYDLATDAGELHNLYDVEGPLALNLQKRLLSLEARYAPEQQPAQKALSPEVVARLRSLGYIAGRSPGVAAHQPGPDPKDRLREYQQYGRAVRFASTDHLPEAIREFRGVLQQDQRNVLAHFYLAVCYYRSRRLDEAVRELSSTLAIAPDYSRAEELLGTIWLQKKDYVRAREQFIHLLTAVPEDYGAHYNLGVLAMRDGRWEEAQRELRAAVAADPDSAQAREALGTLYLQRGDLNQARGEFTKAIELDPRFARAHYNLGMVLLQERLESEAAREFRQALAADPKFDAARKALEQLSAPR